jgi:hypothetical protein
MNCVDVASKKDQIHPRLQYLTLSLLHFSTTGSLLLVFHVLHENILWDSFSFSGSKCPNFSAHI